MKLLVLFKQNIENYNLIPTIINELINKVYYQLIKFTINISFLAYLLYFIFKIIIKIENKEL